MELNSETIKKIRGLIIFTIVALVIGINYKAVMEFGVVLFKMALPFLIGAAIAFIMNVPMRAIEKQLPMRRNSRLKRPVSLVVTIILLIGLISLVAFVVIPELFQTLVSLQDSIPNFISQVQKEAERMFATYPEIVTAINDIQIDWKEVLQAIVEFLSVGAGTVLSSTVSAAMSIVSGFTTFGIAFIFAIYILLQKEVLARQFRQLFTAFLPRNIKESILSVMALTEKTFSHFLTGQCLEAVILGTMFFITLSLFRLPYAVLIGVLIAFTALIPIFGAFIGCGIGIFLMLMVNPLQALSFTVIFFVLQQLEGNLIYPHVVGNSVGLPSIWVLVAVTIGGSAMGIVGMLIFIPLCSVIYSLLRDATKRRLRRRR